MAGTVRKELLDKLKQLDIKAYKTDSMIAITGPTWKVKDNASLDQYLDDFTIDEIGALRDYAAIPTHSTYPFFTDPDILDRNATKDHPCPLKEDLTFDYSYKPYPFFKYFIAGDLSVRGDKTGFAMVHYDHFTQKVVQDFAIGIKAASGTRIDYAPIRDLIYRLDDAGFTIEQILFDQFQSNDCINILREKGYNVDECSYAESFRGCTTLHELICNGKFVYSSENKEFIGEAKELQVVYSKRIDHLMSEGFYNGKDVWDATVNATSRCIEDYYTNGDPTTTFDLIDKMTEGKSSVHDDLDMSWVYN